jgi:plasmid stabilization system protein ParE
VANIDLVFHPDAAEEYVEALLWYSDRGEWVGEAFEAEVERAPRLISDSPDRWPSVQNRFRRVRTRRFPYSIVYLQRDARIWIVALAHGRRRPGFWRGRQMQL